ncbi:zinc ribbon domain-containing protein [Geobacter sp. AOG2]|uniref:FmdB family zinc ribbon protein n=1 Tax=Geobacter sp. AOG2 TaxID=1566347 RepID=UPI001CC53282
MPIFEYSCRKCGLRFEKLQRTGEELQIECPECGTAEIRKELSTFAAVAGTPPAAACSSRG